MLAAVRHWIRPPAGSPTIGSERLDGDTFTTQRHEFAIYAQRPGAVRVPAFPIPNLQATGGKVKSSRTRRGKNRAATALRLAAWGLMRSHSHLGAYLRGQRARLGAPKAITATAHKLARIIYNLMRYGAAYVKKAEAEYAEDVRQRQEKQLYRKARRLGFELTRIAPPEAEPSPEVASPSTSA